MNEFIKPKVRPFMQGLVSDSLKRRFQFYSVPRHFKQFKYDREAKELGFRYLWKIKKTIIPVFEKIEQEADGDE